MVPFSMDCSPNYFSPFALAFENYKIRGLSMNVNLAPNAQTTRKRYTARRVAAQSPDRGVPHPVLTRGTPIQSQQGGYSHLVLTAGYPHPVLIDLKLGIKYLLRKRFFWWFPFPWIALQIIFHHCSCFENYKIRGLSMNVNLAPNAQTTRKRYTARRVAAQSPDRGVPHPVLTRGTPIQSQQGGYSHLVLTAGYPHPVLMGYPHQEGWGTLPCEEGWGNPCPPIIRTWWDTPPPSADAGTTGCGLTHKLKILPSLILRMRTVIIEWTTSQPKNTQHIFRLPETGQEIDWRRNSPILSQCHNNKENWVASDLYGVSSN